MIQGFQEHRDSFSSLVEMVQLDEGVERVAPDFLLPKGVISETRWNEYRALFDAAQIPDGIVVWSPTDRIEFLASVKGLITGGTVKGYSYLSKPPSASQLYGSLDTRPSGLKSTVRAYREIEPGWYVFYEWDD